MKSNKSLFIMFVVTYILVLFIFQGTENFETNLILPEQKFDELNVVAKNRLKFFKIFDKESVIEFASDMFEYNGVKSGMIDIGLTGFTKEELGINTTKVNYTEVASLDGTIIYYIERAEEVVDLYNPIMISGLLAVVVVDSNGERTIVRQENTDFEFYKKLLLKEKRGIQTIKLTNLEMLLDNAEFLGSYEAFLYNKDNVPKKIREGRVYYNFKKNYVLMLTKNNQNVEYFLVDSGVDMYFDHIYEISNKFLEVKGFVTSDLLDHEIYNTFMRIVNDENESNETLFKGDKLKVILTELN